jgi:hypothetical protein
LNGSVLLKDFPKLKLLRLLLAESKWIFLVQVFKLGTIHELKFITSVRRSLKAVRGYLKVALAAVLWPVRHRPREGILCRRKP